jgi:hypothetical protein
MSWSCLANEVCSAVFVLFYYCILKLKARVEGSYQFCLNLSAELRTDPAGTKKWNPEVCQLTEDGNGSVLDG